MGVLKVGVFPRVDNYWITEGSMLALFRKKQGGLKWVLWLVIFALGFGMVLFFVDAPTASSTGFSSQEAAVVAGATITASEFRTRYLQVIEQYRKLYNLDQQDPKVIQQLRLGDTALNGLIAEYAAAYGAEELGLHVTDTETADFITRQPVFRENERFIGRDRYERILQANNLTIQQYEAGIQRRIGRDKLQRILTDGIFSSPDEVEQEFRNRNQEVRVKYVAIDPEEIEPAEIEEEKLQEYYKDNQEKYRVGEKRTVRYVSVRVDPKTVTISEDQLQSRLAEVTDIQQVRVSHILISAEDDEEDIAARKKAEGLLKQIRGGANFAALAAEHSNDIGSAQRGGDLGFFGKGKMVPEFEEAAFALKPGQISDLIRTPFGYHIIKGWEVAAKMADSRRPIAEFELRQNEAHKQAAALANKISNQLKQNPDFEAVAKEYNFPVKESVPFTLGDPVAGLVVQSNFNQKVFALEQGEFINPYESAGSYVVAQLADIQATNIPHFDKVRDQALQDLREESGDELAREQAFAFYQKAQSEGDLEKVATAEKLSTVATEFFKKGTTIDDTLKFSPRIHDRAFRFKKGEISSPVVVTGKYIVFQVLDKTEIDTARLEKEKGEISKTLTEQKRISFFSSYLQNLVDGLRKAEEISVNQELIDAASS